MPTIVKLIIVIVCSITLKGAHATVWGVDLIVLNYNFLTPKVSAILNHFWIFPSLKFMMCACTHIIYYNAHIVTVATRNLSDTLKHHFCCR